MSIEEVKHFQIRTIYSEMKQIIYNEGIYRIYADLNVLKQTSKYFLKNYINFYKLKEINLPKEPIEITEQAFKDFISICQNEEISIKDSILFQLYYLSIKYEVQYLTQLINKYVLENKQKLAIKSLNYKKQIQDLSNYSELKIDIDKDYEINIISSNLIDFIDNDEFVSLPIDVLYSIFAKYFNSNNFKFEISRILFNCLDKYGKSASILFSHINFDNINDLIKLEDILISEYENIFDFSFLNCKSIVKTHFSDRKVLEKQLNEKVQKITKYEKMIKDNDVQLKEKEDQIIALKKQLQEKDDLINKQAKTLRSKENHQYFEGGENNPGILNFLELKQNNKNNKFDKDPEYVASLSSADPFSVISHIENENKNNGLISAVYADKNIKQQSFTIELEKEVEVELIKMYSHIYNAPYSFSYKINELEEEFVPNSKLQMFKDKDESKRIYCIQLNGKKLIKKITFYPKNDKSTEDTWPIFKRIELFKSKNDSKGIFESLIEKREDKDPHRCGVFISSSFSDLRNFSDINNSIHFVTLGEEKPYVKFEITKGYAILTGFRFGKASYNKTIKYQILVTDNDKKNEWIKLYEADEENKDYIDKFDVTCPPIKFIKLVQTGPAILKNGNHSTQLKFYNIEFFGHLFQIS